MSHSSRPTLCPPAPRLFAPPATSSRLFEHQTMSTPQKCVSELDDAQRALRESEQRYRHIFEHASDGIVIADLTGRVLDANGSASRILGFSTTEIVGKHALDIVVGADHHRFEPALGRVTDGATERADYRVR